MLAGDLRVVANHPRYETAPICTALSFVLLSLLLPQVVSAAKQNATPTEQERRILRILVVCRDLAVTSRQWADVFALPEPTIRTVTPDSHRGIDLTDLTFKDRFRRAILQIGDMQIEFVQPSDFSPSVSHFIKGRSAAIGGIVVGLADPAAPRRLKDLEVEHHIQHGREIFLEPATKLGIATEWIVVNDAAGLKQLFTSTQSTPPNLPPAPDSGFRKLSQVSIATNHVPEISQRWSQLLGIVPPKVNTGEPDPTQLFRNRRSGDRFTYSSIPFGPAAIEMLYSTGSDGTLVQEFIDTYGEGPQHIALIVDSMDGAVKQFERFGFGVGMVVRSQANFKINFIEAAEKLGVDVELIWRAPTS